MNPNGILLTKPVTRQPSQILIGGRYYKEGFIGHICDYVFMTTETIATMEKKLKITNCEDRSQKQEGVMLHNKM